MNQRRQIESVKQDSAECYIPEPTIKGIRHRIVVQQERFIYQAFSIEQHCCTNFRKEHRWHFIDRLPAFSFDLLICDIVICSTQLKLVAFKVHIGNFVERGAFAASLLGIGKANSRSG